MPTIGELTPLTTGLSKLDRLEIEKASDSTSYSVSAQDIANYVKTTSNGSFRGSTTKSLDAFTEADVGVWWWVNDSANATGLTSGMVEIESFNAPDDDAVIATFTQRLSYGERLYQRMFKDGHFSGWSAMHNKNGCKIHYGLSNSASVTFPSSFSSVPAVIITPLNSTTTKIYLYNVASVSVDGFTVFALYSDLDAVTTTVTEVTDGTRTTTRTEQIRGAWQQATGNDLLFYWVALSDAE